MTHLPSLEFDEFEEAMRGVDGRYIPVRRNTHDWEMQFLSLADIELMLCRNGGGAVYDGACRADNFGVFFPLSDIESLVVNGHRIERTTLTWLAAGRDFHIYNSGMLPWVGISVGRHTVKHWLDEANEDLRLAEPEHVIGPAESRQMDQLKDLVARIFAVSESTPDALESDVAGRVLHGQLSRAIFESVQSIESEQWRPRVGRPRLERHQILSRAIRLLEVGGYIPVQLGELCRATGVSGKTLNSIFVEHFGISTHRFMMLRRLRAIHEELKVAPPSETIAHICGRFGVWDFGRFSSSYRSIYGVLPSTVLPHQRSTTAN